MTDDLTAGDPDARPEDPWPHSPLPQPEPHGAGATGPRVPWWMVSAGTATVALAALAFVGTLAWPSSSGDNGEDQPAPAAFRPVGQPVRSVPFDQASENAFALVAGSRAYVAWQAGGDLELVAADLATGRELWTATVAGDPERYWAGLVATAEVVAVYGHPPEEDEESEPDESEAGPGALPLVVLSASDGRQRWQRELHEYDQILPAEDTVVLVDRAERVLLGLHPDTGQERWRVPFPGGPGADVTVVPVLTTMHLTGPSQLGAPPVRPPYQRVVMVGEDYTVRVIDARDGAVLTEGTNIADPDDQVLAYQDRLFVGYDYEGYRVDARSLDDLQAQPRHVYITPDVRRRPVALSPCGPDRLCLLDVAEWEGETAEVRAVDLGPGGGQQWQDEVPYADRLLPVGEWLFVGGYEAELVGYDAAGREVLRQPGGAVARLGQDRLLVFATYPDERVQDVGVAGVVVGDERTELGQLTGVRGRWCSWNDTHLVCPGEQDARIWRFA